MINIKEHPRYTNPLVKATDINLECDIVVIGTGAGGAYAAAQFASMGADVIMLEEGPLKTSADFKMREIEAYPDLYHELAARFTKDKAISIFQGRSVGGSTTVNWTSSFRTPDQTLSYWGNEFGLKELSTSAMLPWFKKIEKDLSIAPWSMSANANNKVLEKGARALDWHYDVIPRNVKNCANLGACGLGCPINAKQSMLVTKVPEAMVSGARLFSHSRVSSLQWKQRDISSCTVEVMNERGHFSGRTYSVKAKYFILAAGAIGSPAIMLRSKLPDPNALIGKRTFLHPVVATTAIMENKVNAFKGAPQSIYSDEFVWRDGVSGEAGFKLEVPPLYPAMIATNLYDMGKTHQELMTFFPYLQVTLGLLRDGFHSDSQGGQVNLDSYGYPELDYRMTDYLWRGVKKALLAMAELQFAAGAKRVMPLHNSGKFCSDFSSVKAHIDALKMLPNHTKVFSAHVMGGCGMSTSDKSGIVDSQGKFFHLDNLSIMDGSILPTSLGVNPQLTIYALALRASTALAKQIS